MLDLLKSAWSSMTSDLGRVAVLVFVAATIFAFFYFGYGSDLVALFW